MMGLDLRQQDIEIIKSRSEGWIAGLQLATISMRGLDDASSFAEAFAGDDRHIVDYLVEEVLDLQSEQVQNFLMQTTILARLSAPLCDFVTPDDNNRGIRSQLEASNLFLIPLDNKRQ